MRNEMMIKEWFLGKTQDAATRCNRFIDTPERDEKTGCAIVTNGYVKVIGEKIAESEKAVKVILQTGSVIGSAAGWQTWIPKSVIG